MFKRFRRLRINAVTRELVRETHLNTSEFIYPLFVVSGKGVKNEIKSMPGVFQMSIDEILKECENLQNLGIKSILLFGIPSVKDSIGSDALSENGIIATALRAIKDKFPNLFVITDLCFCEYTDHGHCGILKDKEVDNDLTLPYLAKIALSHVEAGADMVAPSDMMDGRIEKIRKALDEAGYNNIPIMSYAAKYASAFYGPFRDAADSAPSFGDRRAYQMDYHNRMEAIKESIFDANEGADILMVKPALSYLDIIRDVKERTNLPVAAYSVSGEYSMIKNAGKAGLLDEYKTMCESAVSIYRAGADILLTYYAMEIADAIQKGDIG